MGTGTKNFNRNNNVTVFAAEVIRTGCAQKTAENLLEKVAKKALSNA
jgi:hypothetical protein